MSVQVVPAYIERPKPDWQVAYERYLAINGHPSTRQRSLAFRAGWEAHQRSAKHVKFATSPKD